MWISYAQFELSISETELCRKTYAKGNEGMKQSQEKEERLLLLESWKEFEVIYAFILILNFITGKLAPITILCMIEMSLQHVLG